MPDRILDEVACPNCRNPINIVEHGQHLICDACGSRFVLRGHLCPNCTRYHTDEASICGVCGTALKRVCRSCSTSNWAGDEYCIQCGTALDILDLVARANKEATMDRLNTQMQNAQKLKAAEELASSKRMAELMALEEARQVELRRRLVKQKKQERQLLILVFSAIALFLIVLVIYAVLSGL